MKNKNRQIKTVAFSILGTVLDQRGRGERRWSKWRPTISMCQQDDLLIDRMELLFQPEFQALANQISEDIIRISPETEIQHHHLNFQDPWDFEDVYNALFDFSQQYHFKRDQEDYLIHITTGTHVAQICLYLLTETHYLPGKLIQTSPLLTHTQSKRQTSKDSSKNGLGSYQIIDLDLSKYDQIASRFHHEHTEGTTYLKSGIKTLNKQFNSMIEQLEKVSIRSQEAILLTGPTGAGKSQLAKRIYQLKKQRGQFYGDFIVVNCATLRGDNAMSALFGHIKGSYTGATSHRCGLLKSADGGLLFLDEIGELGLDEQAMLLRAIEEKTFLPFGSDKESSSNFQLIAGTNKNFHQLVKQGLFREDLLARINLWTYQLPSLKERIEDLEPNIYFELESYSQKTGSLLRFNKQAKEKYIQFASSAEALWSANFRDLNASIIRMGTLSDNGRISLEVVEDEIKRLLHNWYDNNTSKKHSDHDINLDDLLGQEVTSQLDKYEKIILNGVIEVCQEASSMADAGRKLFKHSRLLKKSQNDSHRVKQILERYNLSFEKLQK